VTATRHNNEVADYLDANAGLSPTIYAGPYREGMADDAITVIVTGGARPDHFFDGGSESLKRPTVQVTVRGSQSQRKAVHDRADTVYDTLSGVSFSNYSVAHMQQGGPLYTGTDGQGRPTYTVNVRLLIKE